MKNKITIQYVIKSYESFYDDSLRSNNNYFFIDHVPTIGTNFKITSSNVRISLM